MIKAGAYNHRYLIEVNSRTPDGQGGNQTAWVTLGYVWARVDTGSLRSRLEHGVVTHTQYMTAFIRQQQRFSLAPQNSKNYRLTDSRGNQYSVVNFEQVGFKLDEYALSLELAGRTSTIAATTWQSGESILWSSGRIIEPNT